uniref:Type I MADS box transcription factor n=1 Tax=Petunia hybrida TaxID=4102 RepID=B6DT60_PETHY|nr:type I MADS box transcription factor [Petunia x hybrida]
MDIVSERALFARKIQSLYKKAQELSTLCDAKVAIVIFKNGENTPILWPSQAVAEEIARAFRNTDEVQKVKKLVKLENYLLEKLQDRAEIIRKKNEEMEMEVFFNHLVVGKNINELDVRQLKGLKKLFEVKKAKVAERKKQLNEENEKNEDVQPIQDQPDQPSDQPQPPLAADKNVSEASTSFLELLTNNQMFLTAMAASQDFGLGGESGTSSGPQEAGKDNDAEEENDD